MNMVDRGKQQVVERWVLGLLVIMAFGARRMEAQEIVSDNEALETLTYPVRRVVKPIKLDGVLSESEWGHAVKVGGFRVSGCENLASEQTVMRLLYDDTALYLGIKCAESRMKDLKASVFLHDGSVWHDDCVEFFIDRNHDHGSYWQFIVNSVGTQYEASGFDSSWSAKWRVATSKTADAWYLEIAVPFKSLGSETPAPGQIWGFNLDRERQAGGGKQLYNWADVKGNFHSPRLFGHLAFVGKDGKLETPAEIARLAAIVQGREAHIYTDGGYWLVIPGQPVRRWSYRDLLRGANDNVNRYWTKLEKIYRERPDITGRKQFETQRSRYQEVRKLAHTTGKVDLETCAAGKTFLDGLEKTLRKLYWKVRLTMLCEQF